jgi:uncharacterized protein (TIGR00369 family)
MKEAAPPQRLKQMSGLEILKAHLAGHVPYEGLDKALGISAIAFEEGRASFAGTPNASVCNPLGQVHGGYAVTILDSAMACAVHSKLKPGQTYVTLELKVAYHKSMTADTGRVEAIGSVLSIGRRIAFAEGKLTDSDGCLIATATSTLLILEG